MTLLRLQSAQLPFGAALAGLPLSPSQMAIYQARTGRSVAPGVPFKEAALICGRRAGKSHITALLASCLAMRDYKPFLAAGEIATIAILASDRKQSRAIFRFIGGLLKGSPLLEGLIEDALRPGLLTIPGSMMIMASSPYSKSGVLYNTFKKHFGRDDSRILVWKGDTLSMNEKADREEIARAYEEDPQAAAAEFGASFREDLIGFITLETLEDITVHGRHSLPRLLGVEYAGFVDPSGGVNDSMALAIGHRDGHVAVLDHLTEIRPPFNPDEAVRQCADICRAYGVTRVVSDKYAAVWPVARFSEAGIALEQSAKPRSDLYLNFLSLANSGRVELLNHGRLLSQFAGLQRRTARSGRDSVDHARDTHDDLSNVCAGVLVGLDLDRRPALVRQSDMLANGAALPLPANCKYIVAVLAVDKNGATAVIYSAVMFTGPLLLIVDFDAAPLSVAMFPSIGGRVSSLSTQCRARGSVVFVPAALVNHAQAVGLVCEPVPDSMDPEELLLSAGTHSGAGRIKLCEAALEKSRTSPFAAALDFRASEGADDPLRAAALLTIALALDQTQQ